MPNRILKETICTSETLESISDFEENLFYRLIVNCDDYGRLDARPAILKSKCYPLRDRLTLKTLQDALMALARAGCVKLYDVDGRPYLCLPTWGVHQQVRAKKSKFPAPDSNGYQMISDDSICPRNPIQSNPIQSESVYDAREGDRFGLSLEEAVARSQLLDDVLAAAQDINLATKGRKLDEITQLCMDYTPEWVLSAILRTADAAKDKWSWFYVRKVLEGWKADGGPGGKKQEAAALPPGFKHVRPPREGSA